MVRVGCGMAGARGEQVAQSGEMVVHGRDRHIGTLGDHGVGGRDRSALRVQADRAVDDPATGLLRGGLAPV